MFINKKINIINFLIALIPLSIIVGNLAINLNIVLICILGLIAFGKKIFIIDDKKIKYLLYSFFFYLVIITLINNISNFQSNDLYITHFLKSIFFLRFLLLFLVLNKVIETNNFNIKFFFISAAFFSFFLAFDVIIQVIFGKDLLGYEYEMRRASGFFGDEYVAGGYLQRFIFFFFFLILLNIQEKKTIIFFLFTFFFIPLIITGNRMSAVIYLFSCVLFFLLEKKYKEFLIIIAVSISIIFFLIKNPIIDKLNFQILNFYEDTKELIIKAPDLFIKNSYKNSRVEIGRSGYLLHFNSGIQQWKQNKIFGQGLKSFPLNCVYAENRTCNTHPHNYLIEIMLDTGLIGLVLIYSIIIIIFKNYIKFYFSKISKKNKFLTLPFFLVLFFEFFPFRSSGSFFTTSNAVIIFLFLAVLMNYRKIKN